MSSHPSAPRRRVYLVIMNPAGYDPLTADPFDEAGIEEVIVPVLHADQMVGEREAMKLGITLDQPQNVTSVIVYCAMKRRGLYPGTYPEFRDLGCVDIKDAPRPAGAVDTEADVIPPTEVSPESVSTSPGTSLASGSTGSTPS